MPVLGTRNQNPRINPDALRRKQLDAHYRKIQYLIEQPRKNPAYTPEAILNRLKGLELTPKDFEVMQENRPVIYNYVSSLLKKKEEASVVESTTTEAAPKKKVGRPRNEE